MRRLSLYYTQQINWLWLPLDVLTHKACPTYWSKDICTLSNVHLSCSFIESISLSTSTSRSARYMENTTTRQKRKARNILMIFVQGLADCNFIALQSGAQMAKTSDQFSSIAEVTLSIKLMTELQKPNQSVIQYNVYFGTVLKSKSRLIRLFRKQKDNIAIKCAACLSQ